MNEFVPLPKTLLVDLIDALFRPAPDDPGRHGSPWGPWGPGGPVLHDWSWVLIQPQPLPPGIVESLPPPLPWHSALLARTVIERVMAEFRLAEAISGTQQSERSVEAVRSHVGDFVDDYCGNRPRKWPFPWPVPLPGWDSYQISPADRIVAGAQFQKMAGLMHGSPLQKVFLSAADRLFEAGSRQVPGG